MGFALAHAYLIPVLPAVAFALVGLLTRRNRTVSAAIALAASTGAWLLALAVLAAVTSGNVSMDAPFVLKALWAKVGAFELSVGALIDPLTAMMLGVVTTVSLLVQIYSVGYMAHDVCPGRFFAFLSLFAASMLGLVLAVSFVQLYVCWELVGACSYLLIGFYYYKDSAREAAKKAFITTRIGDFGMLLGILLVGNTFGTFDFMELRAALPAHIATVGTGTLTVIGLLLFVGPIGKSGQFPLHVWLPDAMEGPTPVSALIHAATMVVAGVYLVARAYFIFSAVPAVMSVIAWVGGFTAFFAATIAVTQRPFKRILAYSTISQLGYMMLALGVGSFSASAFHLMTHAFFKALLFLCAGAVIEAMHEEADIFKMGGLRHRMPVTATCVGIGVLAISGIPPFAGFFSKDAILAAAAEASAPLFVLATVTAGLTAFYMARLFCVAFLAPPSGAVGACAPRDPGAFMRWPLVVLAALSVVMGALAHACGFSEWLGGNAEGIDPAIAGVSIALTLAAYYAAYQMYVARAWSFCPPLLYKWSLHAYYVDELYAGLRGAVIDATSAVLSWFERVIVDGAVRGLSRLTADLGSLGARAVNGQVQQYIAVFYSGVLLLLATSLFVMMGGGEP